MRGRNKWGGFWRTRVAMLMGMLCVVGMCWERPGMAQTSGTGVAPLPGQTAEQVFKNIQVLNGMQAEELQGAMSFIASSLGVDCDFCHNQNFESDKAAAKVRAREMIRMVRGINQETFHGENVVNCFTCHQGSTAPVSIATVLLTNAPRPAAANAAGNAQGETLPSVAEVLDHYVKALGGQTAIDAVKTRVTRTAPLGQTSSEKSIDEVYLKAPGKVLVYHQSEGYTLWAGSNGQQAWAQDSEKSYWGLLNTSQLHSIMRDSEIYPGSRVKDEYKNVVVAGKERVGERPAFVVAGISPEGVREKFYFDVRTGLLLRRHIEEPTLFGWFPMNENYEAYREVDGVKIPFVVRMASAGGAWGVRTSYIVLDVKQNISIEDEKFDHPSNLR